MLSLMVIDTPSDGPEAKTPPSSSAGSQKARKKRLAAPRKPPKGTPASTPLPDGNTWFRGKGARGDHRKGKRAPAHLAKRATLRVRLTEAEMKLAKAIAAKLGKSMGYLVREFLRTYAAALGMKADKP